MPTHRRDESCIMLESIKQNPFRMFLTGEPFSSIQSFSPIELMNLNMQSFQRVNKRVFEHTENSNILMDQQPQILQQKMSNENLNDDDDMTSSSGCSSASSTDGCDDNANSEDVLKIDIVETDNLIETKNCDSANEKCDLNDNNTSKEEEYTDDFYDGFPNDLLNKLPDGLREVIAQIRETTHADLRQRHKESRLRLLRDMEHIRNTKQAEFRARLLGQKSPIVSNGPLNPPIIQSSHHPCVDIGGLTKPLKISPWKLRVKVKSTNDAPNTDAPTKEQPPENDSNSLVIDDTKVTLRKKGTSQINEEVDAVELSNETAESTTPVDDDDELKEFNSLNYWYISPTPIILAKNTVEESNPWPEELSNVSHLIKKGVPNQNLERFFDMFEIPPANDGNDNVHKQKLEKLKANCIGPTQDSKISYFNQPIVPPYLIEYFVSMEHFADSDFNMYCVYNFPAVVLTLKKE